jgi:hypothetical protein
LDTKFQLGSERGAARGCVAPKRDALLADLDAPRHVLLRPAPLASTRAACRGKASCSTTCRAGPWMPKTGAAEHLGSSWEACSVSIGTAGSGSGHRVAIAMLARVDSCIGHAPRLAVWQCRYHFPQSGKPTRSEPGGKIRCKGGVDCKPMLPPKGELSSVDLGIPLSATPATGFKSAPKDCALLPLCCLPLLHPCRRIPWLPRILLLVIVSAPVCPFSNSFIPVIVSRTRRCRLARSVGITRARLGPPSPLRRAATIALPSL